MPSGFLLARPQAGLQCGRDLESRLTLGPPARPSCLTRRRKPMNAVAAAVLFALTPMVASAPGGDACQVASSAVPTPGLPELVMGSKERSVPDDARLTQAQIQSLARQDTLIRRALDEIEARFRKLPAGESRAAQTRLADKALPAPVAHFLASASREQGLLIDVAAASEFQLATDATVKAEKSGEKARGGSLGPPGRRGMEGKFQGRSGEPAKPTAGPEPEAGGAAGRAHSVRR